MSSPNFIPLTLTQFRDLVDRFQFKRRITSVHVHHTWRPRIVDYRGIATIQSMWRFHTQEKGWQDIAQHVTIAPDGIIWTGRSWLLPPVSSVGHNGNSKAGPFMFEIIGDFDNGKEKLDGPQRDSVVGVIAAIQRRNNLSPADFRFHRELGSPKTCPGTGVDREKLLAEVHAAHEGGEGTRAAPRTRAARAQPFSIDPQDAVERAQRELEARSNIQLDRADAEDDHADEAMGARIALGRDLVERAPGARGGDDLDPATLHAMRPHVVNLSAGLFSTGGLFQTSEEDVRAIFDQHLPQALAEAKAEQRPLRIMFWAHGGLVGEKSGLVGASKHISWWKENGVYPIYFVWETGLLATVGQLLRQATGRMRGVDTRDFFDHSLDPVIEMSARVLGGAKIWGGMKFSAQRASQEGGGARFVADRLAEFCKKHADASIEVHASGHSAGSIFHSHFIPAAKKAGAPAFETLHLLAPAVRADVFLQQLKGLIGNSIKKTTVFTMAQDWEKRDNVARIYHKSLLYLVSLAFEPNGKTPILGLEESLRKDPDCRTLFGLDGNKGLAEVVFSKTTVTTGGHATTAVSHADFDEDVPTMNSVVRRVLRKGEADPITEFPRSAAGRSIEPEWPEELDWLMRLSGGSSAPLMSEQTTGATVTTPAAPVVSVPANGSHGHRVALCIGIDAYREPGAQLNGCVNDAKAWAKALNNLGFTTSTLLNEAATRAGIVDAVSRLVTERSAGDVVVLQYAGHGTRLPDVDGDEDDAEDEAMCPVDFDEGHFVIDDDLRALFAAVPKGVSFTCFFDCCHSGTITRVVQQKLGKRQGVRGGLAKKRSLRARPEVVAKHRAFRQSADAPRAISRASTNDMAEVVFTACRSDQVAFESDGQGDFTRIALELLDGGLPQETNDAFHQRIVRAFGEDARQQPQLNSSSAARTRRLLVQL